MPTMFGPARASTSPVFVAAVAEGPPPAGNVVSTLIWTPLACAPTADAAPSDATTAQTAARNAAADHFFMVPPLCSALAFEAERPDRRSFWRPVGVEPTISAGAQPFNRRLGAGV